MTRAWYLGCDSDDVGDRAILVGDRGRVRLVADELDDVVWLNEDRGLTTVTGTRGRCRVTVSAFGMGAPSAAIVLDELVQLGVHTAVRLGTVMCRPPVALGDFVLADTAYRGEATSDAYAPSSVPATADEALSTLLRRRLATAERPWHAGLVASFDAFYPHMAPGLGARSPGDGPPADLDRVGALGVDMETSAVLTVGRALGVLAASLCLATVAMADLSRLDQVARVAGERALVRIGLDVLEAIDDP